MESLRKHLAALIQQYQHKDYPPFPHRPNPQVAGVLIPIVAKDDWHILLTQRPTSMRDHAGEICFPGGKQEGNESLWQTAIRETQEELNIEVSQTIGRISSIPLFTSDYRLLPYIAFVDQIPTEYNHHEVAAVLPISVYKLCRLPFVKGSPFIYQQKEMLSPIFDLDQIMDNPPTTTPIHGGTAIVLYEMLGILCRLWDLPVPVITKHQKQEP